MAACLGVFACLTGRALAHEPPYGTGVYARGAQLVVRSTRGLVSSRSAERQDFRFLCNEALGVAEYDAASVIVRDDQSLLVGSSVGLWRVSPDLCAIEQSDALPNLRVNALRLDPSDSAHIYAATDLGLYESLDQGESFTQLDPHAFDSLEAPATEHDLVYAAGKLASAAGPPRAYFAHWQRERGFELREFALTENEYGAELLGSDARHIFAVAHAFLGTRFEDRLLVSTDGAQTWQNPLSAPSISAFASDDRGAGLLGSAHGLWRVDGMDSAMTQLRPAAVSCLTRASRRLYMCDGAGPEGGVSESSDDGQHWRSLVRWNQVTGLADCPREARAVMMCEVAWEDWQREIPAGTPLTETSEIGPADAGTTKPTKIGCAAMSGEPCNTTFWLALCILPVRLLRRLRHKRTAMKSPLLYTFFALLLLPACARHSGASHSGASNSDGGSTQDASAPASPNMLEDAGADAASSGEAGSGEPSGGSKAPGPSGSGGRKSTAAGSGGKNPSVGGESGSASAGQGGAATQDAGSSDTDSGPTAPLGLCTSCGACEETPKVVSTMHTTEPVIYKDPPPTSGPHNPCWGRWGVHDMPLAPERWVHNLEHGGVVFLYNCPAGCDAEIALLKNIAGTRSRTVVTSYADLPKRFGVVSWGHRLVSECMDEQAFKDFLAKNFDHGPESNANPPNPSCPP